VVEGVSWCIKTEDTCIDESEKRCSENKYLNDIDHFKVHRSLGNTLCKSIRHISQALIRPQYIKLDGMCTVDLSRNAI